MKAEILRALETSILGQSLNIFEEAGSTNDLAQERARAGGVEGETFLALKQSAGRGRLGRSWESPPGKNLLLSVILRPTCPPGEAFLITLVAGVAVFDLLASYLKDTQDLKVKWPNDLYWKDGKIAGILSEMESEGESVRYVICGVGVNINAEASEFPLEIRKKVASLRTILGHEVPLSETAVRFLNFLERRYQSFLREGAADLIRFCDDRSYLKGRRIVCEAPEGEISGIARSLSPLGHLLVEQDDGSIVLISAGDVTIKDIL